MAAAIHKCLILFVLLLALRVTGVYNQQMPKIAKSSDLNEKYPFAAAIEVYTGLSRLYFCGCAIISLNYVLTSADCLDYKTLLPEYYNHYNQPIQQRVVAGSKDLLAGGTVYLVKSTFFPKDYKESPADNNIALAKVGPHFRIGNSINTIVLEMNHASEDKIDFAYFIGWGSVKQSLREIQLEIIPNEECQEYELNVSRNELCTLSYVSRGLCSGDHGGPLLTQKVSQRLVGVATKKYSCGNGFPDVFTKVMPFIEWINSTCNCL